MRKEGFKSVKEDHFMICELIIKNDGVCSSIDCHACPFGSLNAKNDKLCVNNGYRIRGKHVEDKICVRSAKQFIETMGEGHDESKMH